MLELIFETHSISVDNERGIATGWNDGELSKEGRRLAVELGERHAAPRPSVVFSSDLGRAVETATIAFAATGVPIHLDSRLRECDYGELNGMPVERLDLERAERIETPFPGGESYENVVERVRDFLSEASSARSGERVVAIGHSATKWALDYLIDGVPLEERVVAPFDWQPGWPYLVV
jgi:broad specificity phosphatase PhoE